MTAMGANQPLRARVSYIRFPPSADIQADPPPRLGLFGDDDEGKLTTRTGALGPWAAACPILACRPASTSHLGPLWLAIATMLYQSSAETCTRCRDPSPDKAGLSPSSATATSAPRVWPAARPMLCQHPALSQACAPQAPSSRPRRQSAEACAIRPQGGAARSGPPAGVRPPASRSALPSSKASLPRWSVVRREVVDREEVPVEFQGNRALVCTGLFRSQDGCPASSLAQGRRIGIQGGGYGRLRLDGLGKRMVA
jgi:hypothetical protein